MQRTVVLIILMVTLAIGAIDAQRCECRCGESYPAPFIGVAYPPSCAGCSDACLATYPKCQTAPVRQSTCSSQQQMAASGSNATITIFQQQAGPNGCNWNPEALSIGAGGGTYYCCRGLTVDYAMVSTGVQGTQNDKYHVESGLSPAADDCTYNGFILADKDSFKDNFNNTITHRIYNDNFRRWTAIASVDCDNFIYSCKVQRYGLAINFAGSYKSLI